MRAGRRAAASYVERPKNAKRRTANQRYNEVSKVSGDRLDQGRKENAMKRLLLIPFAALLIGILPNVASARTNWFFGLGLGAPYDSFSFGYGHHGTGFGFSLALPPPAYYSYSAPAYYSPPAYYAPPTYYAAPAYAAPPVYYAPAPVYVPSTYFYYNSGWGYPRYYDHGWGGHYHYRH
jgi:hypothetical protein